MTDFGTEQNGQINGSAHGRSANQLSSSPAGTSREFVVRSSATSLLRRLAGVPAGLVRAGRNARRGSFLVLVVGMLAVLAIITIAYVAIGAQDARLKQATTAANKADDVPKQFVDYVGDIIARDALATFTTPAVVELNLPRYAMRETTDFPHTNWTNQFPVGGAVQSIEQRFDPAGSVSLPSGSTFDAFPDRNIPASDPWLADIAPVIIDAENQLASGEALVDSKAVVGSTGLYGPLDRKEMYRHYRDWRHISNLAPDGRFVNLNNLAPALSPGTGGPRVPNLRAQSGFGTYKVGTTTLNRTSDGLTLWGRSLDADALNPDKNLDVAPTTVNAFGLGAKAGEDRLTALWDSYQRGAYRPARDVGRRPGERGYAPNQWADVTGTGFFDARWFELVDARDPNNPIDFLKTDGNYRYFFAAKVVDLSALININTATDLRAGGTIGAKLGLTPADVDLLRILLLRAADEQYTRVLERDYVNTRNLGINKVDMTDRRGYDDLPAPQETTTYTREGHGPSGGGSGLVPPYNYAPSGAEPGLAILPEDAAVGLTWGIPTGYNMLRAERTGHYSYIALRLALASNVLPPIINTRAGSDVTNPWADPTIKFRGDQLITDIGPSPTNWSFVRFAGLLTASVTPDVRQTILSSLWDFNPANPGINATAGQTPDGAENRRDWYWRQARSVQGGSFASLAGRVTTSTDSPVTLVQTGRFGMDDLGELLTYWGSNDSNYTSALERVLGGRDSMPRGFGGGIQQLIAAYSPLRDNRPSDLERAADRVINGFEGGITLGPVGTDGVADRQAMFKSYADARHLLTTVSGARLLRTIPGTQRDKLTSKVETDAQRPFSPGVSETSLSTSELRIDALAQLDGSGRGLAELYRGYADALLPMSWVKGAWATTIPTSGTANADWLRTRTLFYGHAGAETANLIAASMAVNMAALANAVPPEYRLPYEDVRDASLFTGRPIPPPAAVVLVDQSARADLSSSGSPIPFANLMLTPRDPKDGGGSFDPLRSETRVLELPLGQSRNDARSSDTSNPARGDKPVAKALAVYGVQPQPFITGVQTITVYTDAPSGAVNPVTGSGSGASSDPTDAAGLVTIRATLDASNADFLFRILAFQITNPSDTDITLSKSVPWAAPNKNPALGTTTPETDPEILKNWAWEQMAWDLTTSKDPNRLPVITRDDDFYYVQVGGHFFKLAEIIERAANVNTGTEADDRRRGADVNDSLLPTGSLMPAFAADDISDPSVIKPARKGEYIHPRTATDRRKLQPVTMRPITIRAGQTIIAYALSQPPRQILNRLCNVEPTLRGWSKGAAGAPDYPEGFEAVNKDFDQDFQPVVLNIIKGLLYDRTTSSGSSPTIHLNLNFNEDRVDAVKMGHAADPDYAWSRLGKGTLPDQIVWIPEFDQTNVDPTKWGQLIMKDDREVSKLVDDDAGSATVPNANREVLLWRAIRTEMDGVTERVSFPITAWDGRTELLTQQFNLRAANDISNDLLADRFQVPNNINLDARIRAAGGIARVTGAPGGEEWKTKYVDPEIPDVETDVYNTGLTISVMAGAMRPYDPMVASGSVSGARNTWPIQPGMFPSYAMETKFSTGTDWNSSTGAPTASVVGTTVSLRPKNLTASSLDLDDMFKGSNKKYVGRQTLRRWMIEVANSHLLNRESPESRPGYDPVFASLTEWWPQTPRTTTYAADRSGGVNMTRQSFFRAVATSPDIRKAKDDTVVGGAAALLAGNNVDHLPWAAVQPRFAFKTGGIWSESQPGVRSALGSTAKRFEGNLRGADMLLPLAVAPFQAIYALDSTGSYAPPTPVDLATFPVLTNDPSWTTLGEAMCTALGYGASPSPGDINDAIWLLSPRDVYTPAIRTGANDILQRTILDRGQLRLDDFAPFIMRSEQTPSNPPVPSFIPNSGDVRAWTQTPLALNVLDVFTALPTTSLPIASGDPLQRPVPGLLNVNTAPIQTLRALPGLSPRNQHVLLSTDNMVLNGDGPKLNQNTAWWWKGTADNPYPHDSSSDIAATVQAYRDQTPTFYRGDSKDRASFVPPPPPPPASGEVSRNMYIPQRFYTYSDLTTAFTEPSARFPLDYATFPGAWSANKKQRPDELDALKFTRGFWTDVNGLSEEPGFRNPGELFLARLRLTTGSYGWAPQLTTLAPNGPATTWFRDLGIPAVSTGNGNTLFPEDWAMPSNMDYLGYMYSPSKTATVGGKTVREPLAIPASFDGVKPNGVASFQPADIPTIAGSIKARLPGNSYADKLAILNATSNSITTRSDYFACWFLVHGYQESDLLNLNENDPITPSIARRFLVVFDRSNVKAKGDKPRVLLMREVPVTSLTN